MLSLMSADTSRKHKADVLAPSPPQELFEFLDAPLVKNRKTLRRKISYGSMPA
jgi:hypothetical protein